MFGHVRSGLVLGVSALALSATLGDAVSAAEVTANSRIAAVTVYTQGADIVRELRVNVPAGDHVIVINDLPASAVTQSIRVEGKATGGVLQIGSVDTRRVVVPRADAAQLAKERKALEDEIEKLNDDKAVLQADLKAAESQLALLSSMTQMPTRPVTGGGAAEPDWDKIAAFIGDRSLSAQKAMLATGVKMRDLDRRLSDLQRKLAQLAPAPLQRTEIKVHVTASAGLDAELVVRYQVGQAGWMPFYDARLLTGERGQQAKLQLVRRAAVVQRSGEPWDDVDLKLSTTRPGAATAAPDLNILQVDFRVDKPMPRRMSAPVMESAPSVALGRARKFEADGAPDAAVAAAPPPVVAEEVSAGVDLSGLQAEFTVPGKVTVPPNGEQKRVQILSESLDASLLVRTVPALDATAYLYAKTALPATSAVLLPGAVSLFRDGTFVGQGELPQLAQGEEHELGFGADDNVKVKRVVVQDRKGESGIFTTSRAEERNFLISIKNHRANPVPVTVVDRIPVSAHDEIKVEATFRPQPTKRDVKDRRGSVQWDLTLQAGAEAQIALGYRVTAPAARPITYLERRPDEIN